MMSSEVENKKEGVSRERDYKVMYGVIYHNSRRMQLPGQEPNDASKAAGMKLARARGPRFGIVVVTIAGTQGSPSCK